MKYQRFQFKNYVFDASAKTLTLSYGYDDILSFNETYTFDFAYVEYDADVLDKALQQLFFMAGVSYYKAFLAPEIQVQAGELDEASSAFFAKTYQHGLGELFYVNKLDPRTPVVFPVNADTVAPQAVQGSGLLVGVGGGKDSLVSIELLRDSGHDIATWSLNHRPQLAPLIERIGLPHYWVEREWDAQLFELKDDLQAYNGHVPISAIFACVGTIVAILAGRKDSIVSNEQSANEPTLQYEGVAINHQYSKSQEFETDYQALLAHCFGDGLRYYSLLRPLSELRIAEIFARIGFEKYHDVFSSCNRAFVHGNDRMFWDGTCSKCAFVFLMLTPFVPRDKLLALFGGKNLLLDASLEVTYKQLLGIEGDKPLECVGEIKESRAAMQLAQMQYPELAKYNFDLPEDYNYKTIYSHQMPTEIWLTVQPQFVATVKNLV
jgi:hypothetical protein